MPETGESQHQQPPKHEEPTLRGQLLVKTKELGEGITGKAERALYLPVENLHPVGLGRWIKQWSVLEEEFPPSPGDWVREPKTAGFLVLKLPRLVGDTTIYGQLSGERAALLMLQDIFAEDAVARPARLYGYGVRRRTGEPYLILEDLSKFGDYKPLDEYLGEKGQLSEQEALEIAIRIAFVLNKAHQRDVLHGDISDGKLNDIFWNPQKKYLRLIDWALAYFPERLRRFGGTVVRSFGHEREGLGKVLFKLITGRNCPSPARGNITHQDWEKMSQPTRDIIGKAIHLRRDSYRPFELEDSVVICQ